MNKKAGIISGIIGIVLLILLVLSFLFFISSAIEDYKEYQTYKTFCEERESFCYCEWFSCEYIIKYSSLNGFSKETKELCELAEELNDKKTMFKAGCK